MSNPCTRCGNERIVSKTWKEVVVSYGRTTTITHAQFVCIDPKCQKIVESELLAQKEKREALANQKELEKQARAKH
ncbi:MAG: hypothetical protein HYU80_00370 [Candidatus Blackburnbacteria bacterium]|nr:hypothetical protein [Candidatus Blackburnbacteria bacterium]